MSKWLGASMATGCQFFCSAIFLFLLASPTPIVFVPASATKAALSDSTIPLIWGRKDSTDHFPWTKSTPANNTWHMQCALHGVCRKGGRPPNREPVAVITETEGNLRVSWFNSQEFSASFPRTQDLLKICISVASRSPRDRETQWYFTEQKLNRQHNTKKTKWTKSRFTYYANSTGTK